jgi:hypothetical protein
MQRVQMLSLSITTLMSASPVAVSAKLELTSLQEQAMQGTHCVQNIIYRSHTNTNPNTGVG